MQLVFRIILKLWQEPKEEKLVITLRQKNWRIEVKILVMYGQIFHLYKGIL